MTYEELIEPIVAAIERESGFERDTILAYLAGWEAVPAMYEDQHVATAILRGTEIHFAFVDGWRPQSCQRRRIKGFLAPLFDRRGFLTTRIMHSNPEQKTFVQRMGFKPTWQDGHFQYYLMGQLPFERKSDAL